MTRGVTWLAWGGAAVAGLALLPFPGPLRIVVALLAVLVALPLAACPFWAGFLPAGPADGSPRAWSFAAGVIVTSMMSAALFTGLGLAGVPLGVLAGLAAALPVITAPLALFVARGHATAHGALPSMAHGAGLPSIEGWAELAGVAAAPALLVIWLAAVHGTPLGPMDDALDHAGTLRHIAAENRIDFPGAAYAVDPPAGQDPRKGALLTGLAIAGRLARADVLEVWRFSAVVLAPLMVLAYAALALSLFRRWGAALAATGALVLLWDDPFWLLRGAYGGHWGLAIAWAATALLVSGGGMGWGIIAGLATAAVHAYSPFQLLAPLILVYFGRLLWKRLPLSVEGGAILGVIVGAAPLELARRWLAGPSVNPLHQQSMEWLMLPPGPIASPLQLLSWYGYPGVAAFITALCVAPFRRDRAGIFLIASAVAPLLLLLNPWLFRPVGEWIGSLTNKLALVWAYPLAIAWTGLLVIGGVRSFAARRSDRRLAGDPRIGWRAGVSALLAAVAIAVAIAIALPTRLEAIAAGPAPLPDRLERGIALIRDGLAADAVVASDPQTSYAIPALTGRRTIVTLSQHAPPGDPRSLERLETVAELYSDCVPLATALDRVRAEGAQYLLAAPPGPIGTDSYGARSDPQNASILAGRFASEPDRLRPIASAAGAVLYEIEAPAGEGRGGKPAATLTGGEGPPGDSPIKGPVVTDGTVTFAIQSMPFRSARRGEEIRLPAAWRLERPATVYLEYSGHIRFENEALPPIRMPFSLIAKPFRWLVLEPRSGGSYRWSARELPFRGLCPVAAWPAGVWLPDTLQVEVPRELLPGRYRLRIALERLSLYPVFTPADLLSEEDRFSGPVAGLMEIE